MTKTAHGRRPLEWCIKYQMQTVSMAKAAGAEVRARAVINIVPAYERALVTGKSDTINFRVYAQSRRYIN